MERVETEFGVIVLDSVMNIRNPLPLETKQRVYLQSISFGHHSWDFAENMLLGIRESLRDMEENEHKGPLEDHHFESHTERTLKREENSFQFVDFAPLVFEEVRKMSGIQSRDFMVISIRSNNSTEFFIS